MSLEINTPPIDSTAPGINTRAAMLGRPDLLNFGLILIAFVGVLLLVSPVRSYPINDDWIYG